MIATQILETNQEKIKFEEFYHKYRKLLYYVANEILQNEEDAKDAVSEAFVSIAKNFSKIDDIDDPRSKGFAVVIVRNISLNMLKQRNRTTSFDDYPEYQNIESESNTEMEVVEKAEFDRILSEVLYLPEKLRDVLYLNVVMEYSPSEISELLGISSAAVYKRIQRAKKMLIERLEENE